MFSHTKILSIFALRNLFFHSVNHKIYIFQNNRLGVVFLDSYYTVISGFRNLEEATLSLFINFFKIFTYVKPSKSFSTREQQYLTANAQPSDTRANLYLRKFNLHFRKAPRQIFSGFPSERRHQYCARHRQEKSIFRSCCLFSRCLSDLIRTFKPKWDYHYFSRRTSFSLELINFNYNAIPTSYFFGVVWGFFT